MSFIWQNLPQPIFGLSPMDGITDSVFRTMAYRHGPPDVLFTEFVSVEALSRKIPAIFRDLQYENHERPMIAQIYGYEPEAFEKCIPLLAELGFDGVDINMGCPAKSVVHSGGGAALIKTCPHAKTIIKTCAKALDEWHDKTGKQIPLSVKTRLGYDQIIVKDWIGELLECEEISNISIHGRTLKQGYSGSANWDAIAEAAELARGSKILILGNGDLQSFEDAIQKIEQTKVNGVLFGRATYGQPWFFREKEKYRVNVGARCNVPLQMNSETRIQTLLEHARLLAERKDPKHFPQIRKHAGWYLKNFAGASELRAQLVRVNSLAEMEAILTPYLSKAA